MNIPTIGYVHVMTLRLEARWLSLSVLMILCAFGFSPKLHAAELDDVRQLAAIAIQENYTGKLGAAGEQGTYQMMPSTVADRGGFDYAAAQRHLVWIKAQLRKAGVDVNPFNVALVWNAGLSTVLHSRALVRHYRYAAAVEALYHHLPAGRSARGTAGVLGLGIGTSPVGLELSRVGCLEWAWLEIIGVTWLETRPDAGPAAKPFVPVLHAPSGASLTEHYEIAALCSGAGVSPAVPGGASLQTHESIGAITCEVAGAVECRTGWPCRDNGHQWASALLIEGSALLTGHFRATAAMHRRQRAPLAEAVCATLFL